MRVFLDFEASSLSDDSYPIEVGWVFETGEGETHLIRPADDWLDWSDQAEAVHRIGRSTLQAEGEAFDIVAHRMVGTLSGHDLYASAPSWDGKWLSVLLRRAGLPRKALTLRDTDDANARLIDEVLGGLVDDQTIIALRADLIRRARADRQDAPPRHRALADAEAERQVWLAVGRLAEIERRRMTL